MQLHTRVNVYDSKTCCESLKVIETFVCLITPGTIISVSDPGAGGVYLRPIFLIKFEAFPSRFDSRCANLLCAFLLLFVSQVNEREFSVNTESATKGYIL